MLSDLWIRVRALFRRKSIEKELDEELKFHLERQVEKYVQTGLSRDEALRRACVEFGGVELAKEECRDARGVRFLEGLFQDVRYGVRMLRKSPGFTFVAVLTLALGIAASTTIFSVVESVLWRPLPFPDSEHLTALWSTNLKQTWRVEPVSAADYLDWRAQSSAFTSLAAFGWPERRTLTGNGGAELVWGMFVSADFFDILRVSPSMGRSFRPDEEQTGNNRVALISRFFWEKRFRSDPTVTGKTITLDGEQYSIAGVCSTQLRLEFLEKEPDIYVPFTFDGAAAANRADRRLGIVGRLKPEITLARATSEMTAIAERLAQEYPKEDGDWRVRVENLRQSYTAYPSTTNFLYFFLGAVALLFLIACTNVANLLLSRGLARQREFAVRTVLGAERRVLVRQLLVESLLLALCAGAAGFLLATWGVGLFTGLLSEGALPRAAYIRLDARVAAFAVVLSFATVILFGLIPALFASKVDPNSYLKEGARGIVGSSGAARARNTLVAAQVAIALVLLFGAGLFVNSFLRLQRVSLGFDPHNLLTMRIELKGRQYASPEKMRQFYERLLQRMRALPGIQAAVAANQIPLTSGYDTRFVIVRKAQPAIGEEPTALNRVVTTNYFRTMGIRLLAGRDFEEKDSLGAPRVGIINENLVRRYLASEEPLGKELDIVGGWAKDTSL